MKRTTAKSKYVQNRSLTSPSWVARYLWIHPNYYAGAVLVRRRPPSLLVENFMSITWPVVLLGSGDHVTILVEYTYTNK